MVCEDAEKVDVNAWHCESNQCIKIVWLLTVLENPAGDHFLVYKDLC